MTKYLKSKTLIFSIILAALGAIQASWGVVDDYLGPRVAGLAAMLVAVAVAVLRLLTTESLDEK